MRIGVVAGLAGWLFAFLGVVSPGQFDWSVSLNILVMVLVGGLLWLWGMRDLQRDTELAPQRSLGGSSL